MIRALAELDPHGDAWVARIRREHERHAGLPTASWWCPQRAYTFDLRERPVVPVITSALLADLRLAFARPLEAAWCTAVHGRACPNPAAHDGSQLLTRLHESGPLDIEGRMSA